MGFTPKGAYSHDNSLTHFIMGSCNGCHKPVVLQISQKFGGHWDPNRIQGDLLSAGELKLNNIWPKPLALEAPDSVPSKVARCYVEAAEAKERGSWNAACSMYRRTMELGLKAFAPEIEAWKIEKRIDKLAAESKITKDIQTWAHELRLDGNEALHGDEDASEEMTTQMHDLTHFLLVYLYTLPAEIEKARARRQ